MNTKKLEENIEFLSEQVHNAWWEEKKKQGFHAPNECRNTTKIIIDRSLQFDEKNRSITSYKFTKLCDKCHTDMYPYNELPENVKEYDRVTVRTVIEAIKKMGD